MVFCSQRDATSDAAIIQIFDQCCLLSIVANIRSLGHISNEEASQIQRVESDLKQIQRTWGTGGSKRSNSGA